MSLATRCTACGTIFRVVQDQLKVSEGWVRCGRCQEVFSALDGLFDLDREAPPERKPTATQAVAQSMAEFVASTHGNSVSGVDAGFDPSLPQTDETDAIESRFLEPSARGSRREATVHDDFADARFPSELPLDADDDSEPAGLDAPPSAPEPAPARKPLVQRWRDSRQAREAAAISSLLEATPGEAEPPPPPPPVRSGATPEFLRQAERAARWRRPRVRASLTVAAVLLLGTLATQVGVQFRDAFAAQWPEARPTLEALCDVMSCRIEPLRRLSSFTVESSGLTQIEGKDAYRLSLTVQNRGRVELALPSIDLSLTDSSGALIARRAVAPTEFFLQPGGAAPSTTLAAGVEAQLQLPLSARDARISGYTIELFYP